MNKKEIKDLIDRKDFYYRESKKHKSILQYILWSVMLIVGIIFLILAFYHPISQKYSIYKTECHNESVLLYQKWIQPSYFIDDDISHNHTKSNEGGIKDIPVQVNGRDVLMSCESYRVAVTDYNNLIVHQQSEYYLCNFYIYQEKCNLTKVDELLYVDASCVSHSGNKEYALLNCFSNAREQDLEEWWLLSHGECLEHTCDCGLGKDVCSKDFLGWKSECHKTICSKYKVGDYEVEVK